MQRRDVLATLRRALSGRQGGRVLGLDVGSAKCGLSVSDPGVTRLPLLPANAPGERQVVSQFTILGNIVAFPLYGFRRARAAQDDAARIRQSICEHDAVALVVGWPLDSRGKAEKACSSVQRVSQ